MRHSRALNKREHWGLHILTVNHFSRNSWIRMALLRFMKKYLHGSSPIILGDVFNLVQMHLYGAAHGWGRDGGLAAPLPKICHKYPTMMNYGIATRGLLQIKVFWNKGYNVIISFDDFTNKILSHDSNYIVHVAMWFKFDN